MDRDTVGVADEEAEDKDRIQQQGEVAAYKRYKQSRMTTLTNRKENC